MTEWIFGVSVGTLHSTALPGIRGDAGFQPPGETFPKAKALLDKALQFDSTSADICVAVAGYKTSVEWDWSGSEEYYKKAIRINHLPWPDDCMLFWSSHSSIARILPVARAMLVSAAP